MPHNGGGFVGGLVLLAAFAGCGSESVPSASTAIVSEEKTPTMSQADTVVSIPADQSGASHRSARPHKFPENNAVQLPQLTLPASTTTDTAVRPAAAVDVPAVRAPGGTADPQAESRGRRAFTELVAAYRNRQADQWSHAEAAILGCGSAALPALLEGLVSSERQTRELASMLLAQVLPSALLGENFSQRPATEPIAESLRAALADESVEVRVNVAVALSFIEGEAAGLVPVLQELLKAELPHVRTMAVVALGGLGTAATPALPAMERLLSDANPEIRNAAAEAIKQLRATQ